MKYCFIINPNAGKGAFVEELEKNIASACDTAKVDYEIFISKAISDTQTYIKNTAEQTNEKVAFLACGGDGTLCETILSVMELEENVRKNVCVGIVPKGTGNDFVSNFKFKELFSDISAQIKGEAQEIDLLKCNGLYSVNMINIGFDCHVVCKKEEIGKKKFIPRKLAYILSLVITLVRKPTVVLERIDDGNKSDKKTLLLTTLANGSFCGGGFFSNPFASLTDGYIDCVEVKNVSRMRFLRMVSSYKAGTHLGGQYKEIIDHFKVEAVDISFDEETPVSVDGEIIRTKELHINVVPKALAILLPRRVRPIAETELENDVAYSI